MFQKVDGVEVNFHAVHDGAIGPLHEILNDYSNVIIHKINDNSNEKSLTTCLELAKSLDFDYVYFVEDDYYHAPDALHTLIEGLTVIKAPLLTLFDHEDRYVRKDDIDYGRALIELGNKCYWRTAESTTCTWATNKRVYDQIADTALKFKLNDREFFRSLSHRLWSPMTGRSTHCHEPFLSPFVDWKDLCQ